MVSAAPITRITPELLHGQGFQSYINEQGAWWEIYGFLLFFNFTIQSWWTPDRENPNEEHLLNTWEDFLAFYQRYERKKFEPGKPVSAEYIVKTDFWG